MTSRFSDVRYILCDWGQTLCSVAEEAQAWKRCIRAMLSKARDEGLPVKEEHVDSLRALFRETREAAEADPEHREIAVIPVLQGWLIEQLGVEVSAAVLERMERAYWQQWVGCLTVIDGADAGLRELRHRGYRIGLVSNVTAPPHWCRRELERLNVWGLLDGATFSSEVGVRKPHPTIYDDALGKIDHGNLPWPNQVLFVGDSRRCDVVGPAKHGMRTAWICPGGEPWPDDQFPGIRPDLIVPSVAELVPHLPEPGTQGRSS